MTALIDSSVAERHDRLIKFRRRLHTEPELSGQEVKTSTLIARTLQGAGLDPQLMRDDTGVIADLSLGSESDSYIALRADIDCVPVSDEKSVPYRSTREGRCHACGHDVHTTILLGVATIIQSLKNQLALVPFKHNLRLIFQPAEETAQGARSMIDQGAIDSVAAIVGLHVDPFLPAGTLGLRTGYLTASCKRFRAHVRGRGGHSARPHEAIDPVPALTSLVSQFYQLGPRSIDSREPMIITVAAVHAGDAFNVIPNDASLTGTLRAFSPEASNQAQKRMQACAEGVARATGCNIDLEFDAFCPPTNNDSDLIRYFESAAIDGLGPDAVIDIEKPSLGGEDFAFYQELIPGAMARLGASLGKGRERPLHSSLFDIDETALGHGVKTLSRTALLAAANFTISSV